MLMRDEFMPPVNQIRLLFRTIATAGKGCQGAIEPKQIRDALNRRDASTATSQPC